MIRLIRVMFRVANKILTLYEFVGADKKQRIRKVLGEDGHVIIAT